MRVTDEVQISDLTIDPATTHLRSYPLFNHPKPRIGTRPTPALPSQLNSMPVMFVENVGQFDSDVLFQANGANGVVQLTQEAIWMTLLGPLSPSTRSNGMITDLLDLPSPEASRRGVHLRLTFVGANPDPQVEGYEPIDATMSYFIGNEPDNWHSNVPVWGGVRYKDIYPGWDLEISSEQGRWNWRLVSKEYMSRPLQEGATGDLYICLSIEGAEDLTLSGNELSIVTNVRDFTLPLLDVVTQDGSPILLKERAPVLDGHEIKNPYSAEASPRTETTDIPLKNMFLDAGGNFLDYSTFLGGKYDESSYDIAINANNEAYITGWTHSYDFPTTPGAFDLTCNNCFVYTDTFVTKLNATGASLIYSTFIGGDDTDISRSIAVDPSGAAYITGHTSSSDFPATGAAFDSSYNGEADAFILKLNPAGNELIYSTFLGGSNGEQGLDLFLDGTEMAYIVGQTISSDFPTTLEAFDTTHNGLWDAFVTKLNAAGSALVYSTYLGGSAFDCEVGGVYGECAIAVDTSGTAFIAGMTSSSNFPTTAGAFDMTHNGSLDAFVTKLNADGNELAFSTFLGGSGNECYYACAIDIDNTGAYIAGQTNSTDFPTTSEAFRTTHNGGIDGFVAKLNTNGNELIYSSYLGGTADDAIQDIAVNIEGVAYVIGGSNSSDFPTTADSFDTILDGDYDAFVSRLNQNGSNLTYSTYIGGEAIECSFGSKYHSCSIEVDTDNYLYVSGSTSSSDFPITSGGFDTSHNGNNDTFVTRLALGSVVSDDATRSFCTGEGVADNRECVESTQSQTQGSEGDPINTRTGGFDYPATDISIPTTAGLLVFQRSYSSSTVDIFTEKLGFGWTHNHDTQLIFPDDPLGQEGVVLFKAHSANKYEIIDNGDGTYTSSPGVGVVLTLDPGPPIRYTLVDDIQNTYLFDEDGKLLTWTDPRNRSWTYTYDGNDRLDRVLDDTSLRFLDFDYDPQGRIETVTDHADRGVTFGYDAAGDLTSVTDVVGQNWTYTYDQHLLTDVIDPRGVTVVHTDYDEQDRAYRQYDGEGELVVELIYNSDGTTTIIDASGHSGVHSYGNRNTLTDRIDPLGGTINSVYDNNFNLSSFTDEVGDTTQLVWSDDGANLTQIVDAKGNQTDLTYDSLNNLTEVVDPRGFLTTYTYDGTLLTSTTDALGNTTSNTYTSEGYLTSVTDPLGNTTSYTYDQHGQRTSMTDALGNIWTYSYDNFGRLVDTMDPLGRVTHNEYDAAGRLIRGTRNYDPARPQNDEDQYNIVTEYLYDQVGNQIEVIDTLGRTTQYEYDDANRLIRTIDPAGNATTNTYDEAGNLVATNDALGRTTTYEYDELNRPETTTDPLGNTTTTIYNPDGTVASTTDALGNTTTYTYDDLKRIVATIDPLGNVTTSTYDEAGSLVASTDALGNTTTYEHDALGRLIRQTDPLGGVTEHFYDKAGNLVQIIDSNGHATTNTYDALHRLISVTDALGNITTNTYDAVGNQISLTDANGHTINHVYDQLDRLVETIDPVGNLTETIYDALGNVINHIDANDHATTYTYDNLNRLLSQTDALGGVTSYNYDAVGNQLVITDANGNTTTTVYDALNRPVTVTDPNGNTTTTTYDEVGNVVSTSDALGNTTSFAYDPLDRQISVTDPLGNTTASSYDAVGNPISITDAIGVVNLYEYDSLNRLTAVLENYLPGADPDQETNVRTEYTYDAMGNRLTIRDGCGNLTTFTHDALNRLLSETDPLGNTTSYAYDAVGNRTRLTDAEGFSTTFSYDGNNRLVAIDYPEPDADVTFTYDAVGNRLSMIDGVGTTTWVYDGLNRPTSITDPFGGTVGYTYDAVGNRNKLHYPDGKTVNYIYDPANRMTQVQDWDGQWTTYTYDSADRLSTISLPNGVVSNYTYDSANRLLTLVHSEGGENLSSFTYTYDAVGNRVQVVEEIRFPPPPSPPPVDFDGDGTSDIVIFRDGAWLFHDFDSASFTNGVWTGSTPGCIPAAMDYDGDGTDDFTQLCGGAWHFYNDDGSYNKGIWTGGIEGDLPVPADYNGDGTDDVVVWRSGAWLFYDYGTGSFDHGVWTGSPPHWTGGTTLPAPMDFDGDGTADFTVFSGGPWHFYNDDGSYNKGIWTGGIPEDLAVPADYDGDGTEDPTVWRSGAWLVYDFDTASFDYGVWTGAPPHWTGGTTLPAPLDYDGDGEVDFTVFSGGPWHFYNDDGSYNKGIWTGGVAGDLAISRRLLTQESDDTDMLEPTKTSPGTPPETSETTESSSPSPTPTPEETPGSTSTDMIPETKGPTGTPIDTTTQTATQTSTATGTLTPSSTLVNVANEASTPTSTVTSGPSATETPIATPTPSPTSTETPTESSTPSATTVPTVTTIGSPTETLTATPTSTSTAIATYTSTSTVTETSTPTPSSSPTATATPTSSPTPTATSSEPTIDQDQITTTTIDYSYDPLYRLIAADYSTGEYFHYTYDEVGNRLTQETHFGTNTYLYDDANRLIEVDGVPFTWDANGNLLGDGASTYAYDHANRLTIVVQGAGTYNYAYNGMGDRLQQMVNGVMTSYTLDLNTVLPQVLTDGTNTYLYGIRRLGEYMLSEWLYHTPDALGSVRQLTTTTASIAKTTVYKPYGGVLNTTGTSVTNYGFTGEWTDATGLVHLRARYYETGIGRLISKDPWNGDPQKPMSYNNWLYVYANPINLMDPLGTRPLPPYPYPPPQRYCSPYSPPGQCIPVCQPTATCPSTLTSIPGDSRGKGELFVDILKQCPGWWHERFRMNDEVQAIKAALVLAYYWESNSHNVNQPAELHDAMGEAYAHKYWQGVDREYGFPQGAHWLLGGRESVRRRLDDYIQLDLRTDIDIPDGHLAFTIVENIWNKYSHQPGGAYQYQHRPYEWANPSADYRPQLIGLEQGTCHKHVYYVSSGRYVTASALCIITFHQEQCIFDNKLWSEFCTKDCEEYNSLYYPDE